MKRYGMVIRLKPEMEETYRRLHRETWPGVLAANSRANIRNFSIFLRDGWLFAFLEHTGPDFAADMERMARDPEVVKWWAQTDPCQEPLANLRPGEKWWAMMEEVFYQP